MAGSAVRSFFRFLAACAATVCGLLALSSFMMGAWQLDRGLVSVAAVNAIMCWVWFRVSVGQPIAQR